MRARCSLDRAMLEGGVYLISEQIKQTQGGSRAQRACERYKATSVDRQSDPRTKALMGTA